MSEWCSISAIEPSKRDRFVKLVLAKAIPTRCRIYAEDRVDGEALFETQAEYIRQFQAEHCNIGGETLRVEFERGLSRLADLAPVIRSETRDKEIDAWTWPTLLADERVWEDAYSVLVGTKFSVIWSGIEFDKTAATRFGMYSCAKGPEPKIEATGDPGRPTLGRELYLAEFRRRIAAGETCPTLAAEVQALREWYMAAHPGKPLSGAGAMSNNIRVEYRAHKTSHEMRHNNID